MPDKRKMLDNIADTCAICGMCELGFIDHTDAKLHPQVSGCYDPMCVLPKIMIIGQNPGLTEIKEGKPFVGPAGKEFDKALDKYGGRYSIARSHFYITNAVKCFTTDNAAPLQRNIDRCEPFLRMEMAIINPKFVVALGAVAFSALCPGINFSDSLGRLVNSDKFKVKVFATYHPSPKNLSDTNRLKQFEHDMDNLCKLIFRLWSPF